MIIVGLDIATNTGIAVIDNGKLTYYSLVPSPVFHFDHSTAEDYRFIETANRIADAISLTLKPLEFDFIFIEQTNKGRNRTTQKQLEFIHFAVLSKLKEMSTDTVVKYIDTSAWRRILTIKLNKTQNDHNKKVKRGEIRGKITPKHLSVYWANSTYNLALKLKDDDIADAIAIASAGYKIQSNTLVGITDIQLDQLFS